MRRQFTRPNPRWKERRIALPLLPKEIPTALMAVPDPLICEKTGVCYSSSVKERRNNIIMFIL
jgi:hypothetical protein